MSVDFSWHRRSLNCIAQGALTNSKRPECFVKGVYPSHLQKGRGCFVWDHKGKRYVDFITGLGTNLIGYANDRVNQAMAMQMFFGASLSLGTHHEVECAEHVKTFFPFVDAVKFLKTGSEACSAAIKIARAYQGVANGSKNVHQMWLNEISRRLPSKIEDYWQAERSLQGLHQGISTTAKNYGNKEAGSAKICENAVGESGGATACSSAPGEDQEAWKRWRLLCGSESAEGWNARQDFVRSMWRSERARSSQGLHSTSKGDLALPPASRDGTRWLILSDGYHGHHDEFTSLVSPGCGVPTHSGILPLSGNEDLIEIAAAVIVEPVITDYGAERIEYLKMLRDKCTKHGALLIFDEVITGFRFRNHGVCNAYNITPDLICLGKAIANGMPLAVVGGKFNIMNGSEYFVSSSYAGETLSLVAATTTMNLLRSKYDIEKLWTEGQKFLDAFNAMWPEGVWIEGYPTRGVFKAKDDLTKALFFQEACLAGILFGPSWFFNFPLAEEVSNIMGTLQDILIRIKTGQVQLKGELPVSAFAQKMREAK